MTQNSPRIVTGKTILEIAREWDGIAPIRDHQIAMGKDSSFDQVLLPWILSACGREARILDVGCGTGRVSKSLSDLPHVPEVVGVDLSSRSIELARRNNSKGTFMQLAVEELHKISTLSRFELVVANMFFMDAVDLVSACEAIRTCAPGGRMLATIAHPAFWPAYWGYDNSPGFDYLSECFVEANFRVSGCDYGSVATHVHRPLHTYLEAWGRAGLQVTSFIELRGTETEADFPFPRFVAVEATIRSDE